MAEAAEENSNILKSIGYNLGTLIINNPGSTLSYGSELRPIKQLEPLLQYHPLFECFKSNHINGINYPLNDIDNNTRTTMLANTIERGNHKSALEDDHRPNVTQLMK